jgi:hypothetical protein
VDGLAVGRARAAGPAAPAGPDRDERGRSPSPASCGAAILLDERKPTAPLGDRGHIAYPRVDPRAATAGSTSATTSSTLPSSSARRWHFSDATTVALDGGFEPGRLYEVVYKSKNPRVAGCAFTAHARPVSFFKNDASARTLSPAASSRTATASRRAAASCAT